jgi:putative SOS response-associated peptidase YedK
MCGRFFLSRSNAEIARHFGLAEEPALAPRWNIAPSQPLPLVRQRARDGRRVLEAMTWGFVPRFLGAEPRQRPINARVEGIAERPLFRDAFARRRGLVPADGFYEWQHRGRSSRPFAVRARGGALFAMAALFDRRSGPDGESLDSCAIVTTAANAAVAAIHDRMPAILAPEHYALWLDPGVRDPERLLPLLVPAPAESISMHPVDRRVNDVRNDDAELAEPERDLFSLGGTP